MKRQLSILVHIFILLTWSACGLTKANPLQMPSPTKTPAIDRRTGDKK